MSTLKPESMRDGDACSARTHVAARDSVAFLSWRLKGYQDDGDGGTLELRQCPRCDSTIARPTTVIRAVPR
jgi:hypothetical protein